MRITAHLDRYDRHNPDACAIVWLDTQSGKWSREGHVGAGVPPWGHAGHASDGTCLLAGSDEAPLCVLEGLDLAAPGGPFEGETGAIRWLKHDRHDRHDRADRAEREEGRWHVQCVDPTECVAADSLFADEGM
ncbi:MAG: DUF3564 family protein [Paraburkholderia sp.]|uniref:DUF3564 family protein n=1 Tax=Paraburkholderia sp. TaxID=1926495 RepID=UPI00121E4548|nr:DUF3564 family protein [Paraburkholderia sp.]TAM01620.1 MAG: DUF3564 family protein [Paraburkholderia sp.]TAM30785.1 MAG: DUF3564 family protein [Paraburkholderia sp.]